MKRLLAVLLCACASAQAPNPFVADFEVLHRHLGAGYANLEWSAVRQKLDLAALRAETKRALEQSASEVEARAAFVKFVTAFRDPHLRAVPVQPQAAAAPEAPVDADSSPEQACRQMGYRSRPLDFRFAFDKTDKFERLGGNDAAFPAGILTLDGGRRAGLLRIAHFGEDGYPQACAAAWDEFRLDLREACGQRCQNQFRFRVMQRLLNGLAARVREVAAKKIDLLVVDITANGGGTDWVDPAARMLTRRKLHCPAVGYVRRPSTLARFEQQAMELERDLARADLRQDARSHLLNARAMLRRRMAEATAFCENSACDAVARANSFCGLTTYLPPNSLAGMESRGAVFTPLLFEYAEGVWKGRLAVIVDSRTASASEYFANLLQSNRAARIVGARTMGAGCGYVDGGEPLTLPSVGLRILVPNCVRYRADGENERAGIEPDLPVDWAASDDSATRTRKLLSALAAETVMK